MFFKCWKKAECRVNDFVVYSVVREVMLKDYYKEQRRKSDSDRLSWRKETHSRISKHWRHFRGRLNMQTAQTACVSVLLWLGLLHSFGAALQNTVVQNDTLFFCLSQCAIYTAWWFGQRETTRWRAIDHRPSGKRTGNIRWNVQWSGWGHPHAATKNQETRSLGIKDNHFCDLQHWETYTSLVFFSSPPQSQPGCTLI